MLKKKLVKVGLIQSKVSNDLKSNLEKTLKMVESVAKKGAEIICLQELYKTPYFPNKKGVDVGIFTETIPGESTEAFKNISKKYGCSIILPIYEKSKSGKLFNTVVVLNDKGELQPSYRKIHIPHDPSFYEKDYFEEGDNGYQLFKHKDITFAVLICFDQWFPEAARMAKLSGAEIVFYPTAIGTIIGEKQVEGDWHNAWETVMRGHAIANSFPVVAVNRTGVEGKSKFWGQSFITDAFGKVLKRASKDNDEAIVGTLDLSMNDYISESWGFLRNRRPDTYKLITDKNIKK
ncbi:MAG: Agmatine deiminase [Candidatus Nomurabacteria bacterium GW2011_GWF2_35_66]|uniref:Agmatine deiminase n=1 Tax=Candidatus Nomurabacteria bacterium GW2011_GWE1_35_16 TaxID=1618761 RepID=A0A0G0EH10_9BACT|nr:MAG: Agmatine deiminase [Candidatus Nomurabacteria bacterium GW2011_GWF1_34_20]KKP63360.1 MAG: Agmatine deiminase [Candidatus Nomurabacteria bacterium GW2011_GWE2_34_25]KKP66552.1 MAG: Agmatine deiminase [Candidatus Nomurabacteria bacterium GW2011_GWE1_35_16]KKP83598.1 MAG: Agmatine deiminase [Candidatus Nomurabacteria bacterium GW2011_GWF2_35_66]HAE36859.1 acyltransferase [Candidatus Nomurabacteria bacterium]